MNVRSARPLDLLACLRRYAKVNRSTIARGARGGVMQKFLKFVVAVCLVVGFAPSAHAINIVRAEVQNGVAVVRGNKAAKNAIVRWENVNVTQTNNGGVFSFSGAVPNDCIGTLSDGVSTIEVPLLNCTRNATVAYWRFEEGTPGTIPSGVNSVLDSSGNGLDGTPFGHPIYRMVNNPQSTMGLEFNGADARVFVPDNNLLQLTKSLTLEAYIQIHRVPPGNVDYTQIVFRGDDRGALDPYFLALTPDGKLVFHVEDAFYNIAAVVSPSALPLNQTLHVAGTLDDETGAQKLFINGEEVASQVTSLRPFGLLESSEKPGLGIGSLQSTLLPQFFDGIIDEVRISNIALTPSEFLPPPLGVGGLVTGVTPSQVICRNVTTNQRVVIQASTRSWDCEGAGLNVRPGDTIQQTVTGQAY